MSSSSSSDSGDTLDNDDDDSFDDIGDGGENDADEEDNDWDLPPTPTFDDSSVEFWEPLPHSDSSVFQQLPLNPNFKY